MSQQTCIKHDFRGKSKADLLSQINPREINSHITMQMTYREEVKFKMKSRKLVRADLDRTPLIKRTNVIEALNLHFQSPLLTCPPPVPHTPSFLLRLLNFSNLP
jgi:hypothetical protein